MRAGFVLIGFVLGLSLTPLSPLSADKAVQESPWRDLFTMEERVAMLERDYELLLGRVNMHSAEIDHLSKRTLRLQFSDRPK